ncbi:TOBE domain-containing protein [Leptolyngbya ohadii]|uniref:TOBE domain-containing protein n=1 Tax=Leptolyngbya ohadii TaxID=1962290 RepID=UPI000B59EC3D|nr:molybdopterin-binding protein [Leptolyngbya ohadii]
MPRKEQGWITFQASDEERRILEQISQKTQRTKTEILREMIRQMGRSSSPEPSDVNTIDFSADIEETHAQENSSEAEAPAMDGAPGTTMLQSVRISARNILRARVKRIVKGTVNAEVTLAILPLGNYEANAPGVELVSIVTRASADNLELKKGKEVFAIVKSSSVMIAAS